jgi:hypothetical protein
MTTDLILHHHSPAHIELLMFNGYAGARSIFLFQTLITLGTSSLSWEVELPTDENRFDAAFHFGLSYKPDLATSVDGTVRAPYSAGTKRLPGVEHPICGESAFRSAMDAGMRSGHRHCVWLAIQRWLSGRHAVRISRCHAERRGRDHQVRRTRRPLTTFNVALDSGSVRRSYDATATQLRGVFHPTTKVRGGYVGPHRSLSDSPIRLGDAFYGCCRLR